MLQEFVDADVGASTRGDVARVISLTPDPSILGAIGRGHSLTSAVADLVDNSIDAGATRITVRFFVSDDHVVGLRIRDDGIGMNAEQLSNAMTLGKRRNYDSGALGHFGIGLKASSMSQAQLLTVFSDCGYEAPAAMRLRRNDAGGSFDVEVLTDDATIRGFAGWDDAGSRSSGTVVEWSRIDAASAAHDSSARRAWLDQVITELRGRLGLVFHRLLASADLRIEIDQFDLNVGRAGVPRTVDPVDPFGFSMSGKTGYPKTIAASTPSGGPVSAVCHILPPNTGSASAKLLGRPRTEWQGFYFYRNDRLLHAGGWSSMAAASSELQLARVAVDIGEDLLCDVIINPEKQGVMLRPDFVLGLENAVDATGDTTFRSYLDDARETIKTANIRNRTIKPVTPIGVGLPESVESAIESTLKYRLDSPPVSIKWRTLDEGRLFQFDHLGGTIWLNAGYRRQLAGPRAGATDDSPLLKTMLFLLFEQYFSRSVLHSSTREQLDAQQSVLAAALAAQVDLSAFDPLEDDDQSEAETLDVFGAVDLAVEPGGTEIEADELEPGQDSPSSSIIDIAPRDVNPDEPRSRIIPSPRDVRTKRTVAAGRWGKNHQSGNDTGGSADPESFEGEPELFSAPTPGDTRVPREADGLDDAPSYSTTIIEVSDDATQDYLKKIAKRPLLGAEQEVDLARRIEVGQFAEERLAQHPDLPRREARELEWLAREGRRAMNDFLNANLRLVVSIAKRYTGLGMPFLDIIQEGNIGLIRATQKFDFMQGLKFSTYATWWIRQGLTRALADQSRTIRVPVHMVEQINQLKRLQRKLATTSDSPATIEATAAAAGVELDEARRMFAYDLRPLSLDVVLGREADCVDVVDVTLGDLVDDPTATSVESRIEAKVLTLQLASLLGTLTEREAGVIRMRFGLGGDLAKTLDEIGEAYHVTRERIRQIEKATMEKLREPAMQEVLADYMYDRAGSLEKQRTASAEREAIRARRTAAVDADIPGPPEYEEPSGWTTESDLRIVNGYRLQMSINAIAYDVQRDNRDVALRLTELLLPCGTDLDDASLAPRAGIPYTPDERIRLVRAFKHGQDIERIASDLGRTPLAIAWQLFDSPGKLVHVPKRLLHDLHRRPDRS